MTREEIEKAIAGHGMWKMKLATAVKTGEIDTPVDVIRVDNICKFGKWLYGPTVTAAEKSSEVYKTVCRLHAEFHKVAARVAECATTGRKAEAEQLMSLTGELTATSAKLTTAMMEMKKNYQ